MTDENNRRTTFMNYSKRSGTKKKRIQEKYKNNRIVNSFIHSIKNTNITKNNWFIMSWVWGKGYCMSPIDTFINIYIIISIQLLIPFYLIYQGGIDNLFICPQYNITPFSNFLTFSLSLLLSMSTYNEFYNMLMSFIYWGKFIGNNNKISTLIQLISLLLEITVTLFVWILSWEILVNDDFINITNSTTTQIIGNLTVTSTNVQEYTTSYDKVVNVLALTFLTQIDDIFASNSFQKRLEDHVDNNRDNLNIMEKKHPKSICFIGLLFVVLNSLPIIFSSLVTYCS